MVLFKCSWNIGGRSANIFQNSFVTQIIVPEKVYNAVKWVCNAICNNNDSAIKQKSNDKCCRCFLDKISYLFHSVVGISSIGSLVSLVLIGFPALSTSVAFGSP